MELKALFNHSDLFDKMQVACTIAAEAIRVEDAGTANHVNRLLWAKRAFTSPVDVSRQMLMSILASNAALTVSQIVAASDSAIQTKVNAAVNVFADGT
jgi:hypothetical protein